MLGFGGVPLIPTARSGRKILTQNPKSKPKIQNPKSKAQNLKSKNLNGPTPYVSGPSNQKKPFNFLIAKGLENRKHATSTLKPRDDCRQRDPGQNLDISRFKTSRPLPAAGAARRLKLRDRCRQRVSQAESSLLRLLNSPDHFRQREPQAESLLNQRLKPLQTTFYDLKSTAGSGTPRLKA